MTYLTGLNMWMAERALGEIIKVEAYLEEQRQKDMESHDCLHREGTRYILETFSRYYTNLSRECCTKWYW